MNKAAKHRLVTRISDPKVLELLEGSDCIQPGTVPVLQHDPKTDIPPEEILQIHLECPGCRKGDWNPLEPGLVVANAQLVGAVHRLNFGKLSFLQHIGFDKDSRAGQE